VRDENNNRPQPIVAYTMKTIIKIKYIYTTINKASCVLKKVSFCFSRNSVRLAIRKVMYAPSKPGEQPSVEVSKDFMMSPSKLHLECSLDKELYYHGESLSINVHIQVIAIK